MTGSKITSTAIARLPAGTTIWDSEVRGLGVRRQKNDAVFVLKTRANGRQRFLTIGRYQPGVITPERARREATRLLSRIVEGEDPATDRAAAKKMLTVAELCDAYLAAVPTLLLRRSGRPKKESTLVSDRGRIAGHIKPILGRHRIDEVRQDQVENFLHEVAAGTTAATTKTRPCGLSRIRSGKGVATRTVGLLGAIFSYAQRIGIRPDNPARGVVRFADGNRKRRLRDPEYAALGDALLRAEGQEMSCIGLGAVRLLLLTGWRGAEVTDLRWSELELDRCIAILGDTKPGMSVRPLSRDALALLDRQPRVDPLFVFPTRVQGKPLGGLPRMRAKVRTLAGIPTDVAPNVFRHSFASLASDLGYSDATIGSLIGHKRTGTTSRYTHAADDVLLQAADKVASKTVAKMWHSSQA